MMTSPPPVSLALNDLGIPHQVFVHDGPIRSVEQAAAERGQRPEQVVRSILFRLPGDEYLMVLMAGPGQIDWKKLRRHLGINRLTMAKPDEVLRVTGYPRGAVAPVGLATPLKILVDRSVLGEETISMGSGVRGTAIILQSADLLRAIGAYEVGDFG